MGYITSSCWHGVNKTPVSNDQFQIKNGKQVVKVTTDLQRRENQETGNLSIVLPFQAKCSSSPSLAIRWFIDIRVFKF